MSEIKTTFKANANPFRQGVKSMIGDVMGLKSALLGLAGIGSLAGIAAAVGKMADKARELDQLSAALGLTAEELQRIAKFGKLASMGTDEFSKSLVMMSKNLDMAANGMGEAKDAFKSLGIPLSDLKKMKADEQFLAVAKAISRMGDRGKMASASMKIFGEGGRALIPIFAQGEQAIDKFYATAKNAPVLTNETTKVFADLRKSVDGLWTGFANETQNALTPVAKDLVAGLKQAKSTLDAMAADGTLKKWGEELAVIAKGAMSLASTITRMFSGKSLWSILLDLTVLKTILSAAGRMISSEFGYVFSKHKEQKESGGAGSPIVPVIPMSAARDEIIKPLLGNVGKSKNSTPRVGRSSINGRISGKLNLKVKVELQNQPTQYKNSTDFSQKRFLERNSPAIHSDINSSMFKAENKTFPSVRSNIMGTADERKLRLAAISQEKAADAVASKWAASAESYSNSWKSAGDRVSFRIKNDMGRAFSSLKTQAGLFAKSIGSSISEMVSSPMMWAAAVYMAKQAADAIYAHIQELAKQTSLEATQAWADNMAAMDAAGERQAKLYSDQMDGIAKTRDAAQRSLDDGMAKIEKQAGLVRRIEDAWKSATDEVKTHEEALKSLSEQEQDVEEEIQSLKKKGAKDEADALRKLAAVTRKNLADQKDDFSELEGVSDDTLRRMAQGSAMAFAEARTQAKPEGLMEERKAGMSRILRGEGTADPQTAAALRSYVTEAYKQRMSRRQVEKANRMEQTADVLEFGKPVKSEEERDQMRAQGGLKDTRHATAQAIDKAERKRDDIKGRKAETRQKLETAQGKEAQYGAMFHQAKSGLDEVIEAIKAIPGTSADTAKKLEEIRKGTLGSEALMVSDLSDFSTSLSEIAKTVGEASKAMAQAAADERKAADDNAAAVAANKEKQDKYLADIKGSSGFQKMVADLGINPKDITGKKDIESVRQSHAEYQAAQEKTTSSIPGLRKTTEEEREQLTERINELSKQKPTVMRNTMMRIAQERLDKIEAPIREVQKQAREKVSGSQRRIERAEEAPAKTVEKPAPEPVVIAPQSEPAAPPVGNVAAPSPVMPQSIGLQSEPAAPLKTRVLPMYVGQQAAANPQAAANLGKSSTPTAQGADNSEVVQQLKTISDKLDKTVFVPLYN